MRFPEVVVFFFRHPERRLHAELEALISEQL
jgi:hypothetical protein